MKQLFLTIPLLAASALAQSFTIRGDVDAIQGTNLFELDCTRIRLVSTAVDLQALHNASRQQNIEYDMQVVDVSAGGLTILSVLSAVAVPEVFDMGNLRFGRTETWDLRGIAGSLYEIWVNDRNATSLLALPTFSNSWFVGPGAVRIFAGTLTGGFVQIPFQMPTIPALVGVEFTSQALLMSPSNVLSLTHADCKDVRAN